MKAAPAPPRQAYLEWLRSGLRARGPAVPPSTAGGWDRRLASVSEGLARSFGRMPQEPCPLDPEVLGTLARDGYAIDRLTFQSRPGVRVTANLYRPDPSPGRCAAVLSVHGHWPWARIDPHVQPRCIGLAKMGYVCLSVDAFGAGERAIEPGPGTYHGGDVGASLWPAGVPLLGLQVYDNRRAVDYLISRPDVDAAKIAITGASGGGNQSLYAGATDPRLAAVVPVCGIGTYDAYLGAACCVCEALVGGLTYATTGDLLAMIAPRALLVINASRDAIQFSPGEAAKSLAYARERFRLLGAGEKVRQVVVESGHDYNQPMREAMYGWLDRWLRGRGDGGPIPEPEMTLEEPAALRCYPDGPSRPKTIATIPAFALAEGEARLAALPPAPDHPQRWEADSERMRRTLREAILGGFPAPSPLEMRRTEGPAGLGLEITAEPGLRMAGTLLRPSSGNGKGKGKGTAILVRREGMAPTDDPTVRALLDSGRNVLTADLRATGRGKPETGIVAGVPDHNEAEWALWFGRPLLGQWAFDLMRWLDALDEVGGRDASGSLAPYTLVGLGPFGLSALVAAGQDPRVGSVVLSGGLVSYVGEGAWSNLDMGVIPPNVLDVGDVGHLAALVAPRRLAIAGAVEPAGTPAAADRIRDAFTFTRKVYAATEAEDRLILAGPDDLPALLRAPT